MTWTRPAWLGTALLCLAVSLTGCLGPGEGGDELDIQDPYGATIAYDVGTRFTDGGATVRVMKGPIRLLSIKPIMDDGGTVNYLGTRVRLLNTDGWLAHTSIKEFPPTHPEMAGSVPLEGFEIADSSKSANGKTVDLELMFGFEVTANGRSARRGAELLYEYNGDEHKVFIPSYFAVCSPRAISTNCPDEEPDGPAGTVSPVEP
jgi:hypothetical protein